MGIQEILRCICVNTNTILRNTVRLGRGNSLHISRTASRRLGIDSCVDKRHKRGRVDSLTPRHHHSFRGRRKSCRFYEGGYNGLRVAV